MKNQAISVSKEDGVETTLVVATETGELVWNRNAGIIIKDDEYWKNTNICFRIMLRIIWESQEEHLDSREAFDKISITVPSTIQTNSESWVQFINWAIWQKGVAYGARKAAIDKNKNVVFNEMLFELLSAISIFNMKFENESTVIGEIVPKTNELIIEIIKLLKEINTSR